MNKELNNSKLNIFTYSSTPFLESMALDRPCLLIDDEQLDPKRLGAKPYFDALESVNIIHKDIESLCEHVRSIEDNIDNWWNSNTVKIAKRRFCDKFARNTGSLIETLNEINFD